MLLGRWLWGRSARWECGRLIEVRWILGRRLGGGEVWHWDVWLWIAPAVGRVSWLGLET